MKSALLCYLASLLAAQVIGQVANQCTPGGEACPPGAPWSCCTWGCDATGSTCRECLLQGDKCLTDSQCCIGVCDQTSGMCASCVPEGRSCNTIDYAPDYCCNGPDMKCGKDKTCFKAKPIDAECTNDDECSYSCCEKGFHATGKCTDGDMCHMGKIILWIMVVQFLKYAIVIGLVIAAIWWIYKHCFGSKTKTIAVESAETKKEQKARTIKGYK